MRGKSQMKWGLEKQKTVHYKVVPPLKESAASKVRGQADRPTGSLVLTSNPIESKNSAEQDDA